MILFLLYLVTLFFFPHESVQIAGTALQTWFQRLIPTLFPVMVLSDVCIQTNLVFRLMKPLQQFVYDKIKLSQHAIFCIAMGFLAGFPMGAKTIADCYRKGFFSKQEAEYLLSFCNIIGPMYFFGYAIPLLQLKNSFLAGMGLYGISIIYGVILRLIVYKDLFCKPPENMEIPKLSFMVSLENAITDSAETMLLLGGNIIFFSVGSVLPTMLNKQIGNLFAPLIEISSGIDMLGSAFPIYSLITISFGGLCCILQTKCCLQNTDLSLKKYIMHKINLVFITIAYYLVLYPKIV